MKLYKIDRINDSNHLIVFENPDKYPAKIQYSEQGIGFYSLKNIMNVKTHNQLSLHHKKDN